MSHRSIKDTTATVHTSPSILDALPPRLSWGLDEVCELLGISRGSLYRRAREGKLRLSKCGSRTVVLRDDLHQFLETMRTAKRASV